uniref:Uncharacterized protein n=1 Tax=Tetranychus urticae TaxID=32264 RepID=T1KQS9_TETUR
MIRLINGNKINSLHGSRQYILQGRDYYLIKELSRKCKNVSK